MTATINIQCVPTPEIWHPKETGTAPSGITDESGIVITDENGVPIGWD